MTDAVFSFGTEGLGSLAEVENALKQLQRLSEGFKGFGTDFIPPSTIAEVEKLVEKLAQAENEVAGLEAQSANELLAIQKAMATLTAAADAAIGALDGVKGATAAYSESEIAILRASEAAKSNASAVRAEQVAIEQRAAATRADTEALFANIAAQEEAAAAAAKAAERTTFAGGLSRGARRSGDNLTSGLGYNIARQGEFALGMVAQFAAFDAAFQGVKQVKEYQQGVADLNIAMNEGKPVAQSYQNQLADLSRRVGENAAEGFDSAAAGVRAFGALLAEQQHGALSSDQKQAVGLAVTKSATQLGIIGGEGQNKATDQVIAIGTAYGLQAAELSQVTDAIAATKRYVGGEPREIASGLARFAKSASNAGLDINGAASLIGLVQARTGESGDTVATSLSRILQTTSGTSGIKLALQFGSDSTVSAADRATLNNTDATAWQRMQAFSDIFRNGDTSTQNRILSVVGGVRNRAEASSLLGEMPLLNQFNQQLNGTGPLGAAGQGQKQFDLQMSTLGGTIKKIDGDLKAVAADLGQSGLFDLFGMLARAIDPVLSGFDQLLRLLGELDRFTGGGSGALTGAAELAGGAYLYGKLRNGSDTSLTASATALDGSAAALEAAAASLEGAAVAGEGSAAALDSAAVGLDASAAANAEGGFLSKIGGAKGAGIFGGLGLMALGGAISDGHQGSTRNNIGNVASDAGLGAAIGSFIEPGIGTAIGGGLGAIAGAIQSSFQSSAQDKANQSTLDQARAAAVQNLATGNFAGAVKDFRSAVGDLNAKGDGRRAGAAAATADALDSLHGDGTAERIAALTTPATPAGTNAMAMAVAGNKDLARQRAAEAAIARLPRWNRTDLANSVAGNALTSLSDAELAKMIGKGGTPARQPQNVTAQQLSDGAPVYSPTDAQGVNLTAKDRVTAAEMLKKAVQRAVQQSGVSTSKRLTDTEITSIVRSALPGLSQDQINSLIPSIKQTLDSLARGDGVAGSLNALSRFNEAAAPEIVASIDQVRKGKLKLAKSQAEMESINRKFGSEEVNAAGTNASLIAKVFHNLDQKTIDFIRAGANDALTAAKAEAQMANDVEKELEAASGAIGQLVHGWGGAWLGVGQGNSAAQQKANNAVKHAQSVVNAMSAGAAAAGAASALPKIGGGGGGGGASRAAHQYDYLKSAIAEARAARAGGGDLAAAQAALTSAEDQLNHSKKDSAAWWRAYASLWQAKQQLVKAEVAAASTTYMLGHDVTDPVVQARDKLLEAQKQLALDKANHFSNEVLNKDKLALNEAQAASDKAVFDQQLADVQTKEQLGQISQAAYVRWLQNESTRLHSIKNMTRQQYDEMNQIDQALMQANDSMNAQFNLTSIDARGLVYQVRAMSQIAASTRGSIPGAGVVNTNSNNTTINIMLPHGATSSDASRIASAVARFLPAGTVLTARPRRP